MSDNVRDSFVDEVTFWDMFASGRFPICHPERQQRCLTGKPTIQAAAAS